jgi:hypothetical protein
MDDDLRAEDIHSRFSSFKVFSAFAENFKNSEKYFLRSQGGVQASAASWTGQGGASEDCRKIFLGKRFWSQVSCRLRRGR